MYADVAVLLPPISLTDIRGNANGKISFTIDDVSDDFFINPTKGAIFANPTLLPDETNHTYAASLYAVNGEGSRALVETIKFTVIRQDISNPTNGPNRRGCVYGDPVANP